MEYNKTCRRIGQVVNSRSGYETGLIDVVRAYVILESAPVVGAPLVTMKIRALLPPLLIETPAHTVQFSYIPGIGPGDIIIIKHEKDRAVMMVPSKAAVLLGLVYKAIGPPESEDPVYRSVFSRDGWIH